MAATACQKQDEGQHKHTLFTQITPDSSGVHFTNHLQETPEFNIFNYLYFYNGGGVAAGDLNGDHLPELYFTANQQSNKLYLNQGNCTFKDITEQTGLQGMEGWTTGVTFADVNADGKLDIYVSQLGKYRNIEGKNQLYINQGNDENGIPQFTEKAAEYGLDLVGFSTQATFFDYDLDGDLDMYMLNHSVHDNGTFGKRATLINEPHPEAGDKLLRNDNGTFTDVSEEAGIFSSVLGYGLGVSVGDLNLDGYPDIYVGNDFHENDYLYYNNGDGTFTEALNSSMKHTSRFSMGNDIADYNNDGLPDLVALDMLPADPEIRKKSASEDPFDIFSFKLNFGYNYQFSRNSLQLNRGNQQFSEIGAYAGIAATDWSWASLMADYDQDGYKDLFVSNGIYRRSNDLDYINFISDNTIQAKLEGKMDVKDLDLIEKMPRVKVPNYAFRNNGDLTFTDKSKEWGLKIDSYSNGSAYADLDNDGDLDLVVNNIEDSAFIFKNQVNERYADSLTRNYLKLRFEGSGQNPFGVGARVMVNTPNGIITQEQFPTRGYQSSVDVQMVVGLGKITTIPSLTVVWPDGKYQALNQVEANQTLTLQYANAAGSYDYSRLKPAGKPLLEDITPATRVSYRHKENKFVEFNRERLMPHMVSSEGPALATGDVNNDGLHDFYVGGGKWKPGALYVQQPDGTFVPINQETWAADSVREDVDAVFFDADNDGDQDLLVVTGGNEFFDKSPKMLSRLYLNQEGTFTKAPNRLPELFITGACVAKADYDNDGDTDLFLGARAVPWNYGQIPSSHLLQNNGEGFFEDVTEQIAPELLEAGLIKQANWADLDGNGTPDLILAGEWMPLSIYFNRDGKLEKAANTGLNEYAGWWNTVAIADYDNDGDLDMLAGNMGLNSRLQASAKEPLRMYIHDFDDNGNIDQIVTHYVNGQEELFATKDELTRQLKYLNKEFLSYEKFAEAQLEEVFTPAQLSKAEQVKATHLASSFIENKGNGKFAVHELPGQAQLAPVNAVVVNDFNNDGNLDALLAGNFYDVNPEIGRYDADYGTLLTGDGKGNFTVASNREMRLYLDGQVRKMAAIEIADVGQAIVVARNNDTLKVYRVNNKADS